MIVKTEKKEVPVSVFFPILKEELLGMAVRGPTRNIVYKIPAGKFRTATRLTTLEKKDGTCTTDTRSTIMHMLDHFVLDDSDNELHRKIRKEIQEPPDTADDKAFTKY
jgi:hypothetical protein